MLSKSADYALRAVVWLARQPGRPESANRLAEVTQVPRRYLHKVLQDLVHAEIIHSQTGPGGGYSLDRNPEHVTILDIVNAVSPLERIRKCPLGLTSHTRLCPLHRELDKAYAATEEAFSRVTISALIGSTSAIVPLCEVG